MSDEFGHSLTLEHGRWPLDPPFGVATSRSEARVHASSVDLTEAWRELLSRLPNDVYGALKAAMHGIDREDATDHIVAKIADHYREDVAATMREDSP